MKKCPCQKHSVHHNDGNLYSCGQIMWFVFVFRVIYFFLSHICICIQYGSGSEAKRRKREKNRSVRNNNSENKNRFNSIYAHSVELAVRYATLQIGVWLADINNKWVDNFYFAETLFECFVVSFFFFLFWFVECRVWLPHVCLYSKLLHVYIYIE